MTGNALPPFGRCAEQATGQWNPRDDLRPHIGAGDARLRRAPNAASQRQPRVAPFDHRMFDAHRAVGEGVKRNQTRLSITVEAEIGGKPDFRKPSVNRRGGSTLALSVDRNALFDNEAKGTAS